MNEIDRRVASTAAGVTPDYASRHDEWFAWYPVRLGPLGKGRWVWLRTVWRNRCMGVTIYQDLALVREREVDRRKRATRR